MTPEELVIEQKVQQLYANTPNWPQIPQNEMDQLCKQLLTTETVWKITTKAIKKYRVSLDNVEDYKGKCSARLFETLLSVLKKYDPSQGKFIPYFSRFFKLDLEHELLKETNKDSHGGMTMPTSFNGIKIDHVKKLLDQERKQRNASMTKEEAATFLKTHFRLSNKQISYLLNPPTVVDHLRKSNNSNDEKDIIEEEYPTNQMTLEEMAEQEETCHEILHVVQEILSSLSKRSDTKERYNIIATWEVLLWFNALLPDIQEKVEQLRAAHPFLHPQVIADYRTMGKDFYTEAQQLAKRGFFPTKNKVSEYKADFESACKDHPQLYKLIQNLWSRRDHQTSTLTSTPSDSQEDSFTEA